MCILTIVKFKSTIRQGDVLDLIHKYKNGIETATVALNV